MPVEPTIPCTSIDFQLPPPRAKVSFLSTIHYGDARTVFSKQFLIDYGPFLL